MRVALKKQIMQRNKRGVSLPELLFAIGLMAFVATTAIGGIVMVHRVKETIDKQAKANMIMIATVSYISTDLNGCTNPDDMDCTNPNLYAINDNADNKYYPVFYNLITADGRYLNYIIRDKNGTTETVTGSGAKVQYYNTSMGICVGLKLDNNSLPGSVNGITAPLTKRKYILAQNVMDGTGMISKIGGDGKIHYDDSTKLFSFTVEVVDSTTNEIILSQEVKVCPDTLMPANP